MVVIQLLGVSSSMRACRRRSSSHAPTCEVRRFQMATLLCGLSLLLGCGDRPRMLWSNTRPAGRQAVAADAEVLTAVEEEWARRELPSETAILPWQPSSCGCVVYGLSICREASCCSPTRSVRLDIAVGVRTSPATHGACLVPPQQAVTWVNPQAAGSCEGENALAVLYD